MRVLHVGWGFRPFLVTTVTNYAHALMEAQVRGGCAVGYFCAGRHYPLLRRPRLLSWRSGSIQIYELINSRVLFAPDLGTPAPELQLNERHSEEIFAKVLSKFGPDLIHLHDLSFLPSSLIEVAKQWNVPAVMTLHDYFLLCPTVKLFDHRRAICLKKVVGSDCAICCGAAPTDFTLTRRLTRHYEAQRRLPSFAYRGLRNLWLAARPADRDSRERQPAATGAIRHGAWPLEHSGEAFQRRRDVNVERLNKLDLLMANSHRTAEIYLVLGVRPEKMTVLHHAHEHIRNIRFKEINRLSYPIHFATLGGCGNVAKGCDVVLGALRKLEQMGLAGQFKLHVMGGLLESRREELLASGNVVYRGFYNLAELDNLLEAIQVGIVPSVWEEAYGYVGVEFLAKGIPVIGNRLGGIVDYVQEGTTGWLNAANDAGGLAQIMAGILRNPEQIVALNHAIGSNYARVIKTPDKHFEEIDAAYRDVLRVQKGRATVQECRR